MEYAVIKTGGKQYRVEVGETLNIEKLDNEPGKKVTFEEVLLVIDKEKLHLGQPRLENAKVIGEVLSHFRDKKLRIIRFKAKSHYKRTIGHRQSLTKVKIINIETGK